jgi:hypothetical protein
MSGGFIFVAIFGAGAFTPAKAFQKTEITCSLFVTMRRGGMTVRTGTL